MKVVSIIEDDIVNSMTGVNVSVWFAGCDIRCKGCHNKDYWDKDGFKDVDQDDVLEKVVSLIGSSPVEKGLSILGGEPFAEWNKHDVERLVSVVREWFPTRKIYCWTGHTLEDLQKSRQDDCCINSILEKIDYLIDGPFVEELADKNLPLRGSSNQRILQKHNGDF